MTVDLMTALSNPHGDPDAVAMVARAQSLTGPTWYTVTHRQLDTAARALAATLTRLGLQAGDVVAFVSRYSQALQLVPLELAARHLRLVTCHVESTRFDAHRLTLYFTHLPVKAVIGLTGEVVDNLGVELRQLLADDTVVVAVGPLAADLRAAGIDALAMTFVGPAFALECEAHAGLHLDTSVWQFSAPDGHVVVDSAGGALDTGLRGTITDDQCRCGATEPRFVPEASVLEVR